MSAPPTNRESGMTLILALVAMSIVGGLAYRVLLYASAYLEITKTFSQSLHAQQAIRSQIDTTTSPQRRCITQTLSLPSGNTQDWLTCERGNPTFVGNHPISLPSERVDYDTLFADPTPCPGQTRGVSASSFTSPQSAMTCELPSELTHGITSLNNLHCNALTIQPKESNQALVIATPGSLVCEGLLSLAASTLVVAGGDIRIAAIVSTSSEPIAITLLSAHGDIVVGGTSGALSLLALGRSLLSVPPTPPSEAFILPPFTRGTITGVRPLEGD
jgi:type II secretory pathway pseudopilin PulG